MAYCMVYDTHRNKECTRRKGRRLLFTVFSFLCFLTWVSVVWPEGKELLKILLIPGDPDTTLAAAEVFAGELATGSPLQDAVKNFFQSVQSYGSTG